MTDTSEPSDALLKQGTASIIDKLASKAVHNKVRWKTIMNSHRVDNFGQYALSIHTMHQWLENALEEMQPGVLPEVAYQYQHRLPKGKGNTNMVMFNINNCTVYLSTCVVTADMDFNRLLSHRNSKPEWISSVIHLKVSSQQQGNVFQANCGWLLGQPTLYRDKATAPEPSEFECTDKKAYRDWLVKTKLGL